MGQLVPLEERPSRVTPLPSRLRRLDAEDPALLGEVLEGSRLAGRQLGAGFFRSGGTLSGTTANAFMLLDRAAGRLAEMTGTTKGGAFARLEQFFREDQRAAQSRAETLGRLPAGAGTGVQVGAGLYNLVGGLPVDVPKFALATTAGGPIGGFAALGALERAEEGFGGAAIGAAEGAAIGGLFRVTAPLAPLARGLAVGGTVAGSEIAGGKTPREALPGAVAMGVVAGLTSKGRIRARDLPAVAREVAPAKLVNLIRAQGQPKEAVTIEQEPIVEVTPKHAEVAERVAGTDTTRLELPSKVVNLNLRRIRGSDDLKKTQALLTEAFRGEINEARRGEITLEQTAAMARELGMTPAQLLASRKGQAFNAEEITAARALRQSVFEEFQRTASRVRSATATDLDRADLVRLTALYDATARQVQGATAEAGRSLSALRVESGAERIQVRRIRQLVRDFQGASGKELETFADMVIQLKDPAALTKFAAEANRATLGQKLVEVWINGLLSNPVTHAANQISNASTALWSVPETYLAAAMGAPGRQPGRVRFREGNARLFGLVQGMREGLVLAGQSFRRGEDVGGKIDAQVRQAIPGRVGQAVRLPGRFLLAGDAFWKAVGQRQELSALAMRHALREGHRGRALGSRVAELKANPPEYILEAAERAGEYQTFTGELGQIGKGVAQAVQHPAARLIVPFVRTPANIMKFAVERSPFGLALSDVRAKLRKGGPSRADALARMTLGSSIAAWAASEAAAGNITGGGPTEPELRKAWLVRNQPYSIKVGDRWISYGRIEPLATILGTTADFTEIAGQIGEEGRNSLAAQITMAFARNLAAKVYLQGMTNVAEALHDPDRYGQAFISKLAGSAVPAGVAQFTRTQDPILRDTQGAIERIKSRLPGYSTALPALNNIWGEPIELGGGWGPDMISPFYTKKLEPDPVSDEVIRLKARIRLPERKLRDVELTPEQYSEFTRLSGRLARQDIEGFVQSPTYRASQMTDGLRREIIEEKYKRARAAASMLMLREPGLLPSVIQKRVERTQELVR